MAAPLLIVGASARAAAGSAARAGLDPRCLDRYADHDLASSGPARRIDDYPGGLVAAAAAEPPGPWMYVGAIENHPEVIERIAADRPLWGVAAGAVRRVRDPVAMAGALRGAGLPALDVALDPAGLPRDGTWLEKPLRSGAGVGIGPLSGEGRPGCYYQRRVDGTSGSALYVADGRGCRLVGLTRQWVGRAGHPFGYVGSVGPVRAPEALGRQLDRTGRALAVAFGLRGLFGVDVVVAGGVAWPTEVNPRYTASVEVVEWATGRSLLAMHAAAFGAGVATDPDDDRGPDPRAVVGKLIVYAAAPVVVPMTVRWRLPRPGQMPRAADLPPPGTRFASGSPVLTLLERAPTAAACRLRLIGRQARWADRLRAWGPADG